MKILVLSDSHGAFENTKKVVEAYMGSSDMVIHLGDVLYHGPRNPLPESYNPMELAKYLHNKKIAYVRGNCDADVDLMLLGKKRMPRHLLYTFGKHRFLFIHGEQLAEKSYSEFLDKYKADILIHGHTHIPFIRKENNIITANPGSCGLPKNGYKPSYMIIDDEKISILDLSGNAMFEQVL